MRSWRFRLDFLELKLDFLEPGHDDSSGIVNDCSSAILSSVSESRSFLSFLFVEKDGLSIDEDGVEVRRSLKSSFELSRMRSIRRATIVEGRRVDGPIQQSTNN